MINSLAPPKAQLSADGATVTLSRNAWSETFPVKQLRGRIEFYTRLADHTPSKDAHGREHPWRDIYGPVVVTLKRCEKLAEVMG